jgi:hypothetical protein
MRTFFILETVWGIFGIYKFRYIGHCHRYIYCMGRFIILDTGMFSLCDFGQCLRDIWHVEVSLYWSLSQVYLLYGTLHYIGHRDVYFMWLFLILDTKRRIFLYMTVYYFGHRNVWCVCHCIIVDIVWGMICMMSRFGEISIVYLIIKAFIYIILFSIIYSNSKNLMIRPFPQTVLSPKVIWPTNLFDLNRPTVNSYYFGCWSSKCSNYEGDSNENLKSAIKTQNTARLSCKLTIMILMSWRVADTWQYDAGMQHDGEVVV